MLLDFFLFVVVEDVASISLIDALFACFIALIEVWCYKLVSKMWSVLSGLVFGEVPGGMRMVVSNLRYLFCGVVVLICWFGLCRSKMAGGRDDAAIAKALTAMAHVLAQANEQAAVGHRDPGEAEE
jgi:hypothetical protein